MRTRNAVNEIIPGKLYQRGQILSWQRDVKYRFLTDLGINVVVNFWPKMDFDMSEAPIKSYLFLPSVRSEQMLESHIDATARHVARLIDKQGQCALILCEAGVTRSVYFTVLVVSKLKDIGLAEAYEFVKVKMPKVKLKGFMMDRINL